MRVPGVRIVLNVALLALLLVELGCGAQRAGAGRGVILFVGDGMGVASITAARIHKGAVERLSPPTSALLNIDRAPRACLVRTASLDAMVTDSGAAITAMVTGEKVASRAISVRVGKDGAVKNLTTLVELAEAGGLSTGVVTTTRLTHATPAALYAHAANRDDEVRIAAALVPGAGNRALGDGMEVAFGGGRAVLRPRNFGGARNDNRDLVAELQEAGYAYARNAEEVRDAVRRGAEKVLGVFAESHMSFEADRSPAEPDLAEMTGLALSVLQRNPRGYFLLVEGGRIDHAHHVTNGRRAILDVLAFDRAVGVALDRVSDRDVVYVTADHDHTMVIAGYAPVGDDVFTQAGVDADGLPYTALLYANGPAQGAVPEALSPEAMGSADFRERAGVPLLFETHGGMDVPLFVFGPESAYRNLPANIDNTEIFDLIRETLFADR